MTRYNLSRYADFCFSFRATHEKNSLYLYRLQHQRRAVKLNWAQIRFDSGGDVTFLSRVSPSVQGKQTRCIVFQWLLHRRAADALCGSPVISTALIPKAAFLSTCEKRLIGDAPREWKFLKFNRESFPLNDLHKLMLTFVTKTFYEASSSGQEKI